MERRKCRFGKKWRVGSVGSAGYNPEVGEPKGHRRSRILEAGVEVWPPGAEVRVSAVLNRPAEVLIRFAGNLGRWKAKPEVGVLILKADEDLGLLICPACAFFMGETPGFAWIRGLILAGPAGDKRTAGTGWSGKKALGFRLQVEMGVVRYRQGPSGTVQ